MKVRAYTNSFHESVKPNMAEKMTPGMAMGSTIRTIAPIRLHPSIIAHSSMSLGMDLKYAISIQVQNGMRNVG